MRALFSLTVFLSAALLFLIQPLFARMALPRLGGTPAVWNTCELFFQAALLAGYGYAHLLAHKVPPRIQAFVHAALLLAPLAALPVLVPAGWTPPASSSPVGALLLLLARQVGLPFFVLATSAPLIQRWYARTGEKDPYFLYAASNAGSMVGLLGYPFVLERSFALAEQSTVFSVGYVALAVLVAACAFAVRTRPDEPVLAAAESGPPSSARRRLRWVILAAVPSSFLLGLTTYATTDIAAVPLLWVIPLALYLLSFILVFARRRLVPQRAWASALPAGVLAILALKLAGFGEPPAVALPLHIFTFFAAAMACHGALADDRPPARELTVYYFLMSLGGVLGGLFNALVAPVVFTSVAEYPITIVLACALVPAAAAAGSGGALRAVATPVLAGLATLGSLRLRASAAPVEAIALAGAAPLLVLLPSFRRPLAFALGAGAILLALSFADRRDAVREARSFFAVHEIDRVRLLNPESAAVRSAGLAVHSFHALRHGSTFHGFQRLDDAGRPTASREPGAYYHRNGPAGRVIAHVCSASRAASVALVGMGTASLAAYADAGQAFTYFEIDPVVLELAEDPRCFTYLADARARGAQVDVVLGDARLTLAEAKPASFDLIVLDAFSSDAVPVHLLTREAVERVYLPRLRPGGFLLFHITNRFLDMRVVIGALAGELGLVARCCDDRDVALADVATGKTRSRMAVVARRAEDLEFLGADARWAPLVPRPGLRAWTDDFSNLLAVIDWNGE